MLTIQSSPSGDITDSSVVLVSGRCHSDVLDLACHLCHRSRPLDVSDIVGKANGTGVDEVGILQMSRLNNRLAIDFRTLKSELNDFQHLGFLEAASKFKSGCDLWWGGALRSVGRSERNEKWIGLNKNSFRNVHSP